MTKERRQIPDWAQRERQGDLGWIQQNLTVFWQTAQSAYQDMGRGVIVVDTTVQPFPGAGHPFAYFAQVEIEEHDDEDTKRLMREYNPLEEFVIMLLKQKGHSSSYRIRTLQKSHGRS